MPRGLWPVSESEEKTQDSPESSPVEVVCFGKYLLSASSITVAEKKIIVGETNALGGNIYNITPYSLIHLCATLVYFFCK